MSTFTPFSPNIPVSIPLSNKQDIINHIVDRMVKGIFSDGKGYSVDLSIIRKEVEHFAHRNFEGKTFYQLRLIEAIPSLTVTPSFLKEYGFVREEAKDQTAVIYIKFVNGKMESLDQMMKQGHEGSRNYARNLRQFLSGPSRPVHT
jgi:hypothetical protein